MKNLLLALTFLFSVSCNAQKKTTMKPTIDNQFEKLETEKLQSNAEDQVVTERRKDGSYVEYHQSEDSRAKKETPPNSYYTITKIYYSNGDVREKGLTFNANDLRLGIWYAFDKSGTVTSTIDYDKNYKFDFEDVLAFCKKENIPVDKGPILQSTGYHTQIFRKENPAQSGSEWEIRWLKKPDSEEIIKLDGTSGKVVSRREQHFINN